MARMARVVIPTIPHHVTQRVMSFKFTRLPSMLRMAMLLTISEAAIARIDSDHLLKGSVPFISESFPEGDYLYITAKNIKEHGFDFANISYISASEHKEIYSRCSVKKGDVLYIKDGATAGVAMVNNLEDEFSLLSSVALIRPRKGIFLSEFLMFHLNA